MANKLLVSAVKHGPQFLTLIDHLLQWVPDSILAPQGIQCCAQIAAQNNDARTLRRLLYAWPVRVEFFLLPFPGYFADLGAARPYPIRALDEALVHAVRRGSGDAMRVLLAADPESDPSFGGRNALLLEGTVCSEL